MPMTTNDLRRRLTKAVNRRRRQAFLDRRENGWVVVSRTDGSSPQPSAGRTRTPGAAERRMLIEKHGSYGAAMHALGFVEFH